MAPQPISKIETPRSNTVLTTTQVWSMLDPRSASPPKCPWRRD